MDSSRGSSNYTQRVYHIREEEEEEEEEEEDWHFANLLFGAVDIMTFSQFRDIRIAFKISNYYMNICS